MNANGMVAIKIDAEIPTNVPDHIVRTVTEIAHSLKFKNQGGEEVDKEGELAGLLQYLQ